MFAPGRSIRQGAMPPARADDGPLLVTAMMAIFIAALLGALYQGLDISCGCFASQGFDEDSISGRALLRDLGWLVAALYVLLLDRQPLGVDGWLERRRG